MQTTSARQSAHRAIWAITTALLFAALFTITACTTPSPPPPAAGASASSFKEGVPGGVFVDTVEVSAKVTAINTANRTATLMGPDGEEFPVTVGPAAVNFDQIRVGDMVNVTLTEELVVFLDEEGASAPDGSAGMVALAPKGAQPGGVMAAVTQVTATVTAINQPGRTATLQFEDGSQKIFPVRDDIDLGRRKVGEKVVFQVTEMIAISVDKQ